MTKSIRQKTIQYNVIGIIVFSISWLLFSRFIVVCSDFITHIQFARDAINAGEYPPHFLFHWLINSLSGFSGNVTQLSFATTLLLSLVTTLKIILSLWIIDTLFKKNDQTMTFFSTIFIVITLFLSGPIINWWQFPLIYKGQFTPTIWHNPTTILLMPFAIAILLIFIKRDDKPNLKIAILGSALVLISTLCKPNWSLVLLPTLFLLTLIKKFSWKEFLIYLIPPLIILSWQFIQNYTNIGQLTNEHYKSIIIIKPLLVWYGWTKTPFGSLLVSLTFPLSFLYWFHHQIKNKNLLIFTWTLFAVAMGQFLLFAETGIKTFHGNFFWGTVPSLYLVFLMTIIEMFLLNIPKQDKLNHIKQWLCWGLLILHIIGGVYFLYRVYIANDYYA